jgi:hypothetical protein
MSWTQPWRTNSLSIRRPFVIAGGGLGSGIVILWAKWLYVYRAGPVAGAILSILADLVPMAVAIVGIIMSYRTPTREHHFRVTLILVFTGLFGTGILTLNRIRNDAIHKSEMADVNGKLQTVGIQNTQILNGLVGAKPTGGAETEQTSEATRRKSVLTALRNEYILTHDNLSPALIAGTDQPPADWINSRLKQLGEKWTVSTPSPADIELQFVYPTAEVAIYELNKSTDTVLRDPKYSPGIWNLDSPQLNEPLQIPVQGGDYIRPKDALGPLQFIGTPAALQRIKTGDRLFGFVIASCSNCIANRMYWLYIKYGYGGWYAEESRGVDPVGLSKSIPAISKNSDVELAALVPERNRIPIK